MTRPKTYIFVINACDFGVFLLAAAVFTFCINISAAYARSESAVVRTKTHTAHNPSIKESMNNASENAVDAHVIETDVRLALLPDDEKITATSYVLPVSVPAAGMQAVAPRPSPTQRAVNAPWWYRGDPAPPKPSESDLETVSTTKGKDILKNDDLQSCVSSKERAEKKRLESIKSSSETLKNLQQAIYDLKAEDALSVKQNDQRISFVGR